MWPRSGQCVAVRIVAVIGASLLITNCFCESKITETSLQRNGSLRLGNMRVDDKTGVPFAVYDLDYRVMGTNDPKVVAEVFLQENLAKLHMSNNDADEKLLHRRTRTTPAGWTVRFTQHYRGVPVYESDVAVAVNKRNAVTYVSSNYKPQISLLTDIEPEVLGESSIEAALTEMGTPSKEDTSMLDLKLMIFKEDDESYLVWRVRVSSSKTKSGNIESLEFLYNAKTGENILINNRICDKMGGGTSKVGKGTIKAHVGMRITYPSRSNIRRPVRRAEVVTGIISVFTRYLNRLSNANTNADSSFVSLTNGTGGVFDPNPLATASAKYNDEGFVDNCDSNSPQLEAQVKTVTLRDLSLHDCGKCTLDGKYATHNDFDLPWHFGSCYRRNCDDFITTRNDPVFEAVNAYYHIDSMMRYVNEILNVTVGPNPDNAGRHGGVKYDPHAIRGQDNAYYDRNNQRMAFGEGGVDTAEDGDVVVHELGHGLHDWLTDGELSQTEGLSEGVGDYLAASYTRAKGLWNESDPEYNWVYGWQGHNEFWEGRSTRINSYYPDDLKGRIHFDGQFWSSCNMKIWDALGREKSDLIHLVGLSYTTALSNQVDAANAVIAAAKNLEYSEDDIETIKYIYYGKCGYGCGDGEKTGDEECDGFDFGNTTCAELTGCNAGGLACTSSCKIDYSNCEASEEQSTLDVVITTEKSQNNISWSLFDSKGEVVFAPENIHGSFLDVAESMCLNNDCYRFEIYSADGMGISDGDYDIVVDGAAVQGTNPMFGFKATHEVGYCENRECSDTEGNLSAFIFKLTTDEWGTETSWDLVITGSNQTILSGGNYASSEFFTESRCLRNEECYQFTIRDSNGDGICCSSGFGHYELAWNGTTIDDTDPSFKFNASHKFGACGS